MGQEIESSVFTDEELQQFRRQLTDETAILERYFDDNAFTHSDYKAGFELEAWLLDTSGHAAPDNAAFLANLDDRNVVPELATFNFEVNGDPETLRGNALDTLYAGLLNSWRHCAGVAGDRDERILMIGILPNLREGDLGMDNMSHMSRYKALNRQVLKMRDYQPLHLHIKGRDELDLHKNDVMLEAATTSFQIHFQIPLAEAVNVFNASLLASAPMVAVSANSPYLFGRDLWDETRIPLFEQSVEVGSLGHRRVGFGYGYLEESLFECFAENLADYPALLPLINDAPPERLTHLKFHNGTIWRWNRPLIDFAADGRPHLRIEHRVVPSGPTIRDCFANAAFYYGLSHGLTRLYDNVAARLPFADTKQNFYACARYGLDAPVTWMDGASMLVRELILEELLPIAEDGLQALGVANESAGRWLDIIRARTESGQNGACWQRAFVARHGSDMNALVDRYYTLQQDETPVHAWPV